MEDILSSELAQLGSRGLLSYDQSSPIEYDPKTFKLWKKGEHLKRDEVVIDEDGRKFYVTKFERQEQRVPDDSKLEEGRVYRMNPEGGSRLFPYRLSHRDESNWLHFDNLSLDCKPFSVRESERPPCYAGRGGEELPAAVELIEIGGGKVSGSHTQSSVNFATIRDRKFALDISDTHVVLSTG